MSKRLLDKALRTVTILVMVLGVLSFAHHGSTAHIPGLAIAEEEHHAHRHDQDGYEIEDDRPVRHTHIHNAGDHSHVAMTNNSPLANVPAMVRTDWQGRILVPAYSAPSYSLERPPRSAVSA